MKKYNLKAASLMSKLDILASEMFGEFGFSTLNEEEMHQVFAQLFKNEAKKKK